MEGYRPFKICPSGRVERNPQLSLGEKIAWSLLKSVTDAPQCINAASSHLPAEILEPVGGEPWVSGPYLASTTDSTTHSRGVQGTLYGFSQAS